jgi:hypothetical protein
METAQRGESKTFVIAKYYSGDQIDDNFLRGAHGTYGDNKNTDMVLVEKPECEVTFGRPSVDMRIILKCILTFSRLMPYICRTAPLTSRCCTYIFIQQI